ncbi:hypothetical protein COLO4_16019 [Corchorus olitorius]|uniref:Uncharacterized protein n=1 Tax=Corchorus olitorius TaxID=93759 RepID=A0A1R3JKB3_9ROSI|nr:hypothetical protein COLO4_16019 [Corchorus olitorius]
MNTKKNDNSYKVDPNHASNFNGKHKLEKKKKLNQTLKTPLNFKALTRLQEGVLSWTKNGATSSLEGQSKASKTR